jgi:Tol biopolymer transport system component
VHHLLSKLALAALAASAALCATASAQGTTERVSVASDGAQADGQSGFGQAAPQVSANGRFVAFDSLSTNLVPSDTNGLIDVFVRDLQLGTTERVSVSSTGAESNGHSSCWSISGDGRYVAFLSDASNLVPGIPNPYSLVFVHDRLTGATECASVDSAGTPANSYCGASSISSDGRYVTFVSAASNLVPGDTNGWEDVFLHDRQTGQTSRVSVDSTGQQANYVSYAPSMSADDRFVAFASYASNLVPGDTNGKVDVFVRDLQLGTTERVSVDSNGIQGNDHCSGDASISGDGRLVAFSSDASNLVPGDSNGATDAFVHDRLTGATSRVSVATGGAQGDSYSDWPSLSAGGRYVTFLSDADNMVPSDTNGRSDVFVRDLQLGTTERVSVDSNGVQGNDQSGGSSISPDGRSVAYSSSASNLVGGDTNSMPDIFLFERACSGSVSTYCTAKLNSLGCMPSIGSSGLPSQSGPDNFYATATNVRNNKLGMMLWSLTPDSHPFFGGTLCVHSPIKRTPGQNSGGSATGNDCTGSYSYHFTQAYMLQQLLPSDTTVYAQFWSRDPGFAPPNNIGLTNGLSFTICP